MEGRRNKREKLRERAKQREREREGAMRERRGWIMEVSMKFSSSPRGIVILAYRHPQRHGIKPILLLYSIRGLSQTKNWSCWEAHPANPHIPHGFFFITQKGVWFSRCRSSHHRSFMHIWIYLAKLKKILSIDSRTRKYIK